MSDKPLIRQTGKDHLSQILAIYPLAFAAEDLRPLVSELLTGQAQVLSLAAFDDHSMTGHVLFTIFSGEGDNDRKAGALLAPLCVLPNYQKQGLGRALVEAGIEKLQQSGVRQLFVLGDPAYYSRLGFQAERRALPPYPLPEQWQEAWQSMPVSGGRPLKAGQCILPQVWMKPELWLP